MSKRAVFVGRWCPFHKGHLSIMQPKIDQGKPLLILVRDTHYDIYPAELRKRMIEATMVKLKVDARVMIIDDIESINYGRGVGYEVNEVQVDNNIQSISATDIRKKIDSNDVSWKECMAPGADKVLEDYLAKRGIVVWLTGLPKSGKTSIANLATDMLMKSGFRIENLDSNIMRKKITNNLGYSKSDREKNIEKATFISQLLARNGVIALSSFITPYESIRESIRKQIEKEARFVEVYVKASIENCEKRDDDGLYEKAKSGEIEGFTGVSDPFEEPKNPEIILDTDNNSIQECSKKLVEFLAPLI
ncbi:MAG: adenylyl-sulfate kinase [Nanobdellota archaeon]